MEKYQSIVEQLRTGNNQQAIQQLYQAFPSICKLICNLGGEESDAKDVFQDALLVLYRNAQKPDFELTCAPSTYLYSVARFLWKDKLKKRYREVPLNLNAQEQQVIETDVEYFKENQSKTQQLAQILTTLGERCKSLLQAYYYQKMSMKEIASKFDYASVNSAKTQKYKCLERAKKLVHQTAQRSPSKL